MVFRVLPFDLHNQQRWSTFLMQSSPLVLQLLQLRAGLNEKELELIELREQHVQLAVRLNDDASPVKQPQLSTIPFYSELGWQKITQAISM